MSQVGTTETVKNVTTIAGTKSGNGDNTLVTNSDASKRIVLCAVTLQNESTTATTMQLCDGPSSGNAFIERVLGQNQGDGIARTYPAGVRPKLSYGNNLVLSLSGANSCGYTIQYYLETSGQP